MAGVGVRFRQTAGLPDPGRLLRCKEAKMVDVCSMSKRETGVREHRPASGPSRHAPSPCSRHVQLQHARIGGWRCAFACVVNGWKVAGRQRWPRGGWRMVRTTWCPRTLARPCRRTVGVGSPGAPEQRERREYGHVRRGAPCPGCCAVLRASCSRPVSPSSPRCPPMRIRGWRLAPQGRRLAQRRTIGGRIRRTRARAHSYLYGLRACGDRERQTVGGAGRAVSPILEAAQLSVRGQ